MSTTTFPGPILVTGATGRQGGALIRALLSYGDQPTILALTRSANSASAQKLAAKSSKIKLVEGNLDDIATVFDKAQAAVSERIWGVFSVQVPVGSVNGEDTEEKQGKALVDAALKHGVKYFVYNSVDRGGNEKSWDNPTNVPHFRSKHFVELHLRDAAKGTDMQWTILRPVAFTDNLVPGFATRVFLASLSQTLRKDQPLQWVAAKDIGIFAARAFASASNPADQKIFVNQAIGLAGDELTIDETSKAFENATGRSLDPTFWFLGSALKMAVKEVRLMVNWFGVEGYGVDIKHLRSIHPKLLNMEDWIREESAYVKRD